MVNELVWNRIKELPGIAFQNFTEDCKLICDISDVTICNGLGEDKPEFSQGKIWFNGDCSKGEGSETFCIQWNKGNWEPDDYGLCYEFSKIDNQPYGIVCMACLIAAKYHFGKDFYVKCEGKPEEWKEAFLLASSILGANIEFLIETLFEKPSESMKTEYKQKKEEERREERKGKPERLSIDTADVAKLVRKDLKNNFPHTKFNVRIERYSGGSSINVNWTNGPSQEKVSSLCGHYKAGHFDGMIDCYEYSDSPYCNKFIFFNREFDNDLFIKEARRISKEWGVTLPEDIKYNELYETLWREGDKIGTDLQRVVYGEIHQLDF